MVSVIKLASKAKWLVGVKRHSYQLLVNGFHMVMSPVGNVPVYVGEKRQKFFIPVKFLSHPLFRMLLERAYREYGFQHAALMFPCSATSFEEVVTAAERSYGQFKLESLIEELM